METLCISFWSKIDGAIDFGRRMHRAMRAIDSIDLGGSMFCGRSHTMIRNETPGVQEMIRIIKDYMGI